MSRENEKTDLLRLVEDIDLELADFKILFKDVRGEELTYGKESISGLQYLIYNLKDKIKNDNQLLLDAGLCIGEIACRNFNSYWDIEEYAVRGKAKYKPVVVNKSHNHLRLYPFEEAKLCLKATRDYLRLAINHYLIPAPIEINSELTPRYIDGTINDLLTELHYRLEHLEKVKEYLTRRNEVNIEAVLMGASDDCYAHALIKYTLGHDVVDLVKDINQSLIFHLDYFTLPDCERLKYKIYFSAYEDSLSSISLAILLGCDKKNILKLNEELLKTDQDYLIETIIKLYTGKGKVSKKFTFEKKYSILKQVIEAKEVDRPELMQAYLKKWYSNMRSASWYGNHMPHIGGYRGYWSMESGVITLLLNIDDTLYRDMKYYPNDIVDFARKIKIR